MDVVPFEPAAIARYPTLASWDADASTIVATMLARWHLTPGTAFVGGISGAVLAVETADGSPAILKVGYPHSEAIWEAVGLASFPPGTAPRILDQDAWTWSMLLEPIVPGLPLAQAPLSASEALRIGGTLQARLSEGSIPAGVPTLSTAMGTYVTRARERLPGQLPALRAMGVADLVRDAIDTLESLAASRVDLRLIHGDFNPGNILQGDGDRWFAVDPKPLAGDPAFDLWPLVSQTGHPFESHDPAGVLAEHLRLACSAAGVDNDRAANWSYARAGLNVSWYLADGAPAQAAQESVALRAWAIVAGR